MLGHSRAQINVFCRRERVARDRHAAETSDRFTIERGELVQLDVAADSARLRELDLAVL